MKFVTIDNVTFDSDSILWYRPHGDKHIEIQFKGAHLLVTLRVTKEDFERNISSSQLLNETYV
jgi:hypothetical protein